MKYKLMVAVIMFLMCYPLEMTYPMASADLSRPFVPKCQEVVTVTTKDMLSDSDLLHPTFRMLMGKLIDSCRSVGIDLRLRETYRTPERQDYLLRRARKVTYVGGGNSFHQYGLAADVVIVSSNGRFIWNDRQLWCRIGEIGEGLGLVWGGRWRKLYDPSHFQLAGVDIEAVKLGSLPKAAPHELADIRAKWGRIVNI